MKKEQEAPVLWRYHHYWGYRAQSRCGGVSMSPFISGWRGGAGIWEGLLVVTMWQKCLE